MIQCKKQLSSSHATETRTFTTCTFIAGAYIADPVRFVSVVCAQSPFIAVGGDAGGGHTKLGITYSSSSNIQSFSCLLVYEGSDSWEEAPTNSHHPCPICIISKSNFTGSSRYRTAKDKHSLHESNHALLSIDPERIVPTPLHLFLGLSNRIITDAFTEIFGKEVVEAAMNQVTTIHTVGCGGKSDLYDLNGPEIKKWIKKGMSQKLKEDKENITPEQTATHSILTRWLQQLHQHLLHKKEWNRDDIEAWSSVVGDIHSHWEVETKIKPFPKLHMLTHTVEFAERHRFLGRAAETQIESFHFPFNTLYHKHHFNQAHNTAERIRRCLADTALHAVQAVIV